MDADYVDVMDVHSEIDAMTMLTSLLKDVESWLSVIVVVTESVGLVASIMHKRVRTMDVTIRVNAVENVVNLTINMVVESDLV